MSRRYGRNQRRKAREALAGAENEVAQLEDALRLERRERDYQKAEARRLRNVAAVYERQMTACRKVLGDSIALPPVEELVDSRRFREMAEAGDQVARRIERMGFDMAPAGAHSPLESMVTSFELLTESIIEAGIELKRGGLHEVPHAYVTTKQGAIMYRCNLASLAQIYEPEATARVSHLLAREFIDTLRRSKR